jgi:hypothetical protein
VKYFCVASCMDGDTIKWTIHNVHQCRRCPPRPPVIPMNDFGIQAWSQQPLACERPPGGMPRLSVLILALNETLALNATLRSYAQGGLLQVGTAAESLTCLALDTHSVTHTHTHSETAPSPLFQSESLMPSSST